MNKFANKVKINEAVLDLKLDIKIEGKINKINPINT